MNEKSYSFDGTDVFLENGMIVRFPFPIGECIHVEEILVVRLKVPRDEIFNQNIYGLNFSGDIVWQIERLYSDDVNAPFGNIFRGDYAIIASNFRGLAVYLEPSTGIVLSKMEQPH